MDELTILVFGASGVIGRQLVPMLLNSGFKVVAVDRVAGVLSDHENLTFIHDDILNLNFDILVQIHFDVCINLAASFERTSESEDFIEKSFDDNLQASHKVLKLACKNIRCTKYIFASSYLVYDEDLYLSDHVNNSVYSLREKDVLRPRNLIGATKLMHEAEIDHMSRYNKGMDFLALRIFRGIGQGSNCVISRWIRKLLAGEPIEVFNQQNKFDYIYSKDSALAIFKSALGSFSGTYNVGSGHPRSVDDVICILRQHFPDADIHTLGEQGKYEFSASDNSAIETVCDFQPLYSLEDAISEMVHYEKSKTNQLTQKNIVVGVSSSGNKVPLINSLTNAISLSGHSVKCLDLSLESIASKFGYNCLSIPETEDKNRDLILTSLIDEGIDVILPTRDGELPFFSKNKEFFEHKGIYVIISPLNAIEICQNKIKFNKFCESIGIKSIRIIAKEDVEENFPVFLKPVFGSASKNCYVAYNHKDFKMLYDENVHMIQPFIDGVEYSFDSFSDSEGKVIYGISRTRDIVLSGESRFTRQVDDQEGREQCVKLLEELGVRGPAVTQYFRTLSGEVLIIEVNPRFGGASTALPSSGALIWDLITSWPVKRSDPGVGKWKFGRHIEISQLRYNVDKVICGNHI